MVRFVERAAGSPERTLSFDNTPLVREVATRLINRGSVTLETTPSGNARRRARVEIKVHGLPLLVKPFAPVIEQILAKEARRMLDGEASAMRAWLAKHRAAAAQSEA